MDFEIREDRKPQGPRKLSRERAAYLQLVPPGPAPRPGRRLSRAERSTLWELTRRFDGDDKATVRRKEQQTRSLLFVTATRARDQLTLIYSGDMSSLLNSLRV